MDNLYKTISTLFYLMEYIKIPKNIKLKLLIRNEKKKSEYMRKHT